MSEPRELTLRCWRCEGRGWVRNGDIEDGMMTGFDKCLTCAGQGRVSELHLILEIERMIRTARIP